MLRVGRFSLLLGLTLADILRVRAQAAPTEAANQGPGFNRARGVIMIYLQGGPSHLDLWDPKDNVPERVRSSFNAINTALPGVRSPPRAFAAAWVAGRR